MPAVELPLDFAAKEGDTLQAVVIGIDSANFVVNMSVKRFEQVQNRKVVAQYLKQAPRPTLGQLLQGALEESNEEAAEAAGEEDSEEKSA